MGYKPIDLDLLKKPLDFSKGFLFAISPEPCKQALLNRSRNLEHFNTAYCLCNNCNEAITTTVDYN